MKKWMALLAALWLALTAAPALAGGADLAYAVVNNPNPNDRLNLRVSPTRDTLSLGKYYNGVTVKILAYADSAWAHVQVGDVVGYMMTQYLVVYDGGNNWKTVEPVMPQAELRNPYADSQYLLSSTDTAMQQLVPIPNGAPITVLGTAER